MQTVTSSSFHLHKASILSRTMGDSLPDTFDLVVVGTGLVESMVAAAAARLGHTVLHIDTAGYYGGQWAAFTWDGLQTWLKSQRSGVQETTVQEGVVSDGETLIMLGTGRNTVADLVEVWHHHTHTTHTDSPDTDSPDTVKAGKEVNKHLEHKSEDKEKSANSDDTQEPTPTVSESPPKVEFDWTPAEVQKQSRKFNIDLVPRLLFSRGDMVELLISSNISRYTEFKSVTRVLTLLNGSLEQVPSSRADVFNTRHITVVEKRILMKFLTSCIQEEQLPSPDLTFGEMLKQQKLSSNLTHFVLHSIAMVEPGVTAQEGLNQTRKFLSSLGRFGPTPFLWSMYGTGELPQAFCRLCAVFGGVYYLGRTLDSVIVKDGSAVGVVTEGKRIQCNKLVLPASLMPPQLQKEDPAQSSISRAILLSTKSILPTDKEQLTFLRLPRTETRAQAVNLVEVSAGAAACPKGLHLMHVSAEGQDLDLVSEVSPLLGTGLLYSLSFTQYGCGTQLETSLSNVWSAPGPQHELDLDLAIQQARDIYRGMYPQEEFLPRAPDPEEIIIGGGEDGDGNEAEKAKDENVTAVTNVEEDGVTASRVGQDDTTTAVIDNEELVGTAETVKNVVT